MYTLAKATVRKMLKAHIKNEMSLRYPLRYYRTKEKYEFLNYAKNEELFIFEESEHRSAAISFDLIKSRSYICDFRYELHHVRSLEKHLGVGKLNMLDRIDAQSEYGDGMGMILDNQKTFNTWIQDLEDSMEHLYWPLYQGIRTMRDAYEFNKFYHFRDISRQTHFGILWDAAIFTKIFEPHKTDYMLELLDKSYPAIREKYDHKPAFYKKLIEMFDVPGRAGFEAFKDAEDLIAKGWIRPEDMEISLPKQRYEELYLARRRESWLRNFDSLRTHEDRWLLWDD